MAIGTYAELQAAVARWMHRTNLTGDIPDFIMLAEKRITTMLNADFQNSAGTITTVSGQQYADLPSDLLNAFSLSIPNVTPSIDYVTLEQLNSKYYVGSVGTPQKYSILAGRIYFGPTPDAVYTVKCFYEASIPALSDDAPTNTLLTTWPNIYLWGSLVEAAKFARDKDTQSSFNNDFLEAMESVNILDWSKAGPLTVRSDVRSV